VIIQKSSVEKGSKGWKQGRGYVIALSCVHQREAEQAFMLKKEILEEHTEGGGSEKRKGNIIRQQERKKIGGATVYV